MRKGGAATTREVGPLWWRGPSASRITAFRLYSWAIQWRRPGPASFFLFSVFEEPREKRLGVFA